MARCMLLDAKLSTTFCAETVNIANYMQNRLPTRAINKTPYECWNEKQPGISHFKVFGNKCFVHIPAQKRHKLENTAKQMIFVGYDEQSKAYRCYDPSSKKLVISRDVRFPDFETVEKQEIQNEVSVRLESNNIGDYTFLDDDNDEYENEQFEDAVGTHHD